MYLTHVTKRLLSKYLLCSVSLSAQFLLTLLGFVSAPLTRAFVLAERHTSAALLSHLAARNKRTGPWFHRARWIRRTMYRRGALCRNTKLFRLSLGREARW